jgi:DNA-binding transcriptional LysR family regulator
LRSHITAAEEPGSEATLSVLSAHWINSNLKTYQLALLVGIDEKRSLMRAAAAAGITQPAASKVLFQIETVLQVKLFDRHARGMTATRYGEILVRHARQALCALRLAREEIATLKSGASGQAAIGTVLNPATDLVPKAIVRMRQRYPDILASVEMGASPELVQKLLQGDLDMVVGRVLDSTRANELVYEPFATDEPHAVIASARHPLAGRKGLQLEDLVGQAWILPPVGNLVRDKLTALFVQHGLSLPTNAVQTLSVPVITSLLEQSDMVVVLPEEAVRCCCRAGVLTVLVRHLPLSVGAFGLITRRHHKLSPGAQLMLTTMRELAAELWPDESLLRRFIA